MSQEQLLRLVLAVLSVVLYINHHVLHRSPQKGATKAPTGLIEASIGVTASLWTLSLALFVLNFDWFNYAVPLPLWLRWAGVVLMTACFPLSAWIYRALGEHFSKKLELQTNHRLIDNGPYRFVRHPMYATLLLCASATCLISANLIVMAMVGAVAVVFVLRIQQEEAMLVGRFGQEYSNYRRHTAALVPGLL